MLNRPKFMSPSTNMQEYTIDVTADKIPFSCIVDGNEAINAWQIIIYSLNDNSIILDTGKIDLSTKPFFPIDEKNRNVVFEINIKDYISDNTTFINRIDAYYWTITFWGTSGGQTTSCEEVFYANTTPKIDILFKYSSDEEYSILHDAQIIDNKSCMFKAIYTQTNSDETSIPLKRYGWRLKNSNNDQILVDTISQNQIYGIADNMVLEYDGFVSGGNYSIEVYVETQNNVSIQLGAINFSVNYITTFLSGDFKVQTLKDESGIMLDWSESVVAGGKMIDVDGNTVDADMISFKQNYPIVSYIESEGRQVMNGTTSVFIPENNSVVYDYGANFNLDIDENCYIVLSMQILDNSDRLLFNIEGVNDNGDEIFRRLSFTSNAFEYTVLQNDKLLTVSYSVSNLPHETTWYTIIMSPLLVNENNEDYIELKVVESKSVEGLYPLKDSLYPSTSLYPYIGTWKTLKVGEA